MLLPERTRSWTVLVERKMRSRVVMILAQVTLAQDDKVIQAFAADRTDQSFNIGFCQDDRAAEMASVMPIARMR